MVVSIIGSDVTDRYISFNQINLFRVWFYVSNYQGRIQGSSSYANEEVIFPSSETKKQAKRVFKVSLEVLSGNIFCSAFL